MCTWSLGGIKANRVDAEIDVSKGLTSFQIVGLPEAAVRESKDRVRAAIKNSGFSFPIGRITINLSPGDMKKEGSGFDLPIALGILSNTGIIEKKVTDKYFVCGELSLDGSIKPQPGILAGALLCSKSKFKGLIISEKNFREASVINDIDIIAVGSLSELVMILRGEKQYEQKPLIKDKSDEKYEIDFSEVKGQEYAKRALEIAAAGGHNLSMSGPPGSGKTMLASRIPTILPDMTYQEMLESSVIYSASGIIDDNSLIKKRPFRAPHHTISYAGLIGGGKNPKPGEISLAHRGILFLDEFTEFRKDHIEMLRQPLESKKVIVARAEGSVEFPADFILIAAMNPCPCGYLTSRFHECRCSSGQILKYKNKLSGPILDRIDIQIEVSDISFSKYSENGYSKSSEEMKKNVLNARLMQKERYLSNLKLNSEMTKEDMEKYCFLDSQTQELLKKSFKKFKFSARALDKILKVSRTIADIENSDSIEKNHLFEALQYRTCSYS